MSFPTLTNVRLRVLADTALADPDPTALRLEYKRTTDGTWLVARPPFTAATVVWRDTWQGPATNATAHAITWDAGVPEAGQVLLLLFAVDGPETCTINATNFPGWVKLGDQVDSTSVMTGSVFYKVATGGESAVTVDTTTEQSTAIILCLNNAGTPAGTSVGGNSANADPPLHTPGVSLNYLWIAACMQDAQVVATAAPTTPSAFGNLTTQVAAGTGGASVSSAELTSTASSLNPGVFTSAAEQWAAWTIAVPPASVPAIQVSASSQIAASGENTTAQLSAPASGSFGGGRLQDDENPADAVDLGLDAFGEWEWCLQATSVAVDGATYEFRVTRNGTLFDAYSVTPQWTIGAEVAAAVSLVFPSPLSTALVR